MLSLFLVVVLSLTASLAVRTKVGDLDPCAHIAGEKWVSPREARDCMFSFPVDPEIKANIIQVVNATLPFHTSVNYQILAPPPFRNDVHEDIAADLARISQMTYESDFDFHLDLYHSFKRLNDGHSLYISYLPTPLVLLAGSDGSQQVHIAPGAFTVASAEFPDQIEFWQDALPGNLRGKLASLSGAKVLQINGEDPFVAVNENAATTGGYQGFGTRQNSFFSSYSRGAKSWAYIMGNFAQQIHPLTDSVELTIQRINSSLVETISIPYRSRFGSVAKNFTDASSYRANNCVNVAGTNGLNLYDFASASQHMQIVPPIAYLQQQPIISYEDRKQPINVMLDATPLSDVELPEEMLPAPIPLNESYSVAQFYLLKDNITGVLALGSFSAANFSTFMGSLLDGLQELKSMGATRLIPTVPIKAEVLPSQTNNGGVTQILHFPLKSLTPQSVASPDSYWTKRHVCRPSSFSSPRFTKPSMLSTEPQAGLDTCTRAGTMARLIVDRINKGADPEQLLSYNPSQWKNSSNIPFSVETHWLEPTVNLTINECQPFEITPPEAGIFDSENIVIISNGRDRCGSSCSLFSIEMSKNEGVKTAVLGGHKDVPPQYCGVVGGQSLHFADIDTEIKSTQLKNHTLAPPDFKTNSFMGITWRLAFGLEDPNEPEEWQDHPADFNLPLTREM
ncbi:hypothetical protein DFH07DRAFT_768685 [Mycena maculata]|uniref:Uncharacterized protein n=1 Tax=Mycena maculata TaxID=230809 RepID=A0AAD7JTE9_9AGAR|nr:hypothetical protein DFH07DRAFT_768685 [Mycena maculata]